MTDVTAWLVFDAYPPRCDHDVGLLAQLVVGDVGDVDDEGNRKIPAAHMHRLLARLWQVFDAALEELPF